MDRAVVAGARFQYSSDQSLLVYFDSPIEEDRSKDRPLPSQITLLEASRAEARPLQNHITIEANEKVRRLLRLLEREPVAGVRNLHPAYCSVMIKFDAL